MAELDVKTRTKIIEKQKDRYAKASKKNKGKILDGLCMTTGLSRSRVKHLLTSASDSRIRKRRAGRKTKYTPAVREALEQMWLLMDFACGRRLVAGIGDMLDSLLRFGEVSFDADVLGLLKDMSASTADRLLRKPKELMRFKGISTTKPGTLLKKDIPIRLGTKWDDAVPGFLECDLVAHCGTTTAGEYINTLDMTDIATGWTETRAVINKAQKHVFDGIVLIRQRLPFPLLGIDSDNGSEFINHELYRYCKQERLVFTRSRSYQKNDGCYVEQKNWTVVRRNVGYSRFEGQTALDVMNAYYDLLRLYTNFFLPSAKLKDKTRDGARVKKSYEPPVTPYRRAIACVHVLDDDKEALSQIFSSLNPAAIKRDMISLLDDLAKLACHP